MKTTIFLLFILSFYNFLVNDRQWLEFESLPHKMEQRQKDIADNARKITTLEEQVYTLQQQAFKDEIAKAYKVLYTTTVDIEFVRVDSGAVVVFKIKETGTEVSYDAKNNMITMPL